MLKWIKSWAMPSRKETLGDVLSSDENREGLLGVLEQLAPTREKVERDSIRAIQYSHSKDYAIFAKEAWAQVIENLDKLTSDKLTERQVDFYRGKLSSTLDLLRISYLARNAKEQFDLERKQTLTTN